MKRKYFKLIKTILFNCLWIGLLASCDDFMKAEAVIDQINSHISYLNAENYSIFIDYPNGCGVIRSPAGEIIEKKVTDRFTLSFDCGFGYAFFRWKVTNRETGQELPQDKYFTFDSITSEETQCTFIKAPEDGLSLCIEAELVETPHVLYQYPVPYSTGYSHDLIQIFFDQDINPDSIYYTGPEVTVLKEKEGYSLKSFFDKNNNNEQMYYGYTAIENGKTVTYFKNISIIDINTGRNLCYCFENPVFENNRLLIIQRNWMYALSEGTQVQIELKNGFSYKIGDRDFYMNYPERWHYEITKGDEKKAPGIQSYIDEYNLERFTPIPGYNELDKDSIDHIKMIPKQKFGINGDKKVYIKVAVTDTGSGLKEKFEVEIQKIGYFNNENFVSDQDNAQIIQLGYDKISPIKASFEREIDISQQCNKPGVYVLRLNFYDKNENAAHTPDLTQVNIDKAYYYCIIE